MNKELLLGRGLMLIGALSYGICLAIIVERGHRIKTLKAEIANHAVTTTTNHKDSNKLLDDEYNLAITGQVSEGWYIYDTNPVKWTNLDSTVVWQYRDYREELYRCIAQDKAVEAFNKTNTNPDLSMIRLPFRYSPITWHTNMTELGYRSDGMVVWRTPPEVK